MNYKLSKLYKIAAGVPRFPQDAAIKSLSENLSNYVADNLLEIIRSNTSVINTYNLKMFDKI